MKKQFKDLAVEEKFIHNDIEYIKINPIRVSCCKSLNAQQVADVNNKIFIQPLIEVNVND